MGFILYLVIIIVYTVDCSSVCPGKSSEVNCRPNFLSRFFSKCQTDRQCKSGFKCCPKSWCIKRCIRVTVVDGCKSQSDCSRNQCCVNTNARAKTGVCQNRRGVAASCHNPRSTGFHFASCSGPAGIVHPDLYPCSCGNFCAMGPNPSRDSHAGYIGTCSFG